MPRRFPRTLLALAAAPAALALGACGEKGIALQEDDPYYGAAVIFQQRCAGCHTLDVAGAEGSAFRANSREGRDGPNFNVRNVDAKSALYAIQNGGFSSNPMPQNIVVGRDAELVACFVAKYAGQETGGRGQERAQEQSEEVPGRSSEGQTGEEAFNRAELEVDCPA